MFTIAAAAAMLLIFSALILPLCYVVMPMLTLTCYARCCFASADAPLKQDATPLIDVCAARYALRCATY